MPTQGLLVFVYSTATAIVSSIFLLRPEKGKHAPASTLVMSNTRMPANGKVAGTASAAVARPRHIGHIEPLKRALGLRRLEMFREARERAMPTVYGFT